MIKEIKEDTNKWKGVLCRWIGITTMAEIAILLKVIYRFNAIPIKITMAFFTEIKKKKLLKFIWSQIRHQTAKELMRKKKQSRGITLSDCKLNYTPMVIKTVCYWHKNRKIDRWNRMESTNKPKYIRPTII